MDPNQAADTLSSLVVYEAEVNGIASSMAPSLHPNGSGPAGLSSSSSSGRAAPSSGAVTDMAGSPSDVRGASGQGDERAREPTEQVLSQSQIKRSPPMLGFLGEIQRITAALEQQLKQVQVPTPTAAPVADTCETAPTPPTKDLSPVSPPSVFKAMTKRLKKLGKKYDISSELPTPVQLMLLSEAHPELFSDLEKLMTEAKKAKREAVEVTRLLQAKEEELAAARSGAAALKQQAADLKQQAADLKQQGQDQLDAASTALKNSDNKVEGLEMLVQQLRLNIKNSQKERTQLKAELEVLDLQLASALEQLKVKDRTIKRQQKQLEGTNRELESVKAQVSAYEVLNKTHSFDLADALKSIDKLTTRVTKLQAANLQLTDKKSELELLIAERDARIREVGDALAHLREEHESVSGRRDQLIRELGQVRADKVAAERRAAGASNRADCVTNVLQNRNEEVAALRAREQHLLTTVQSAGVRIRFLEESLNRMGQQLTNTLVDSSDMARVLEHAQQEAAAANTAGEMAVAYYTNAMTTLEGQLKSEKARSAELQQDKVRLQLEVAALKAQLDTAQAANKTQKTATSESAVQCDQGDGPLTTWLPMFKLG